MASTASVTTLENGLQVPVAELKTIDLALLEAGSSAEIEKMAQEARDLGFFYLDLKNSSSSRQILDSLPLLYSRSEMYFDQPKQVKMNDVRCDQKPSQDRGYKFSECDETFEMAFDELVTAGNLNLPGILQDSQASLAQFSNLCHSACLTMLNGLSRSLRSQGLERLEDHHRRGHLSDSGLKLIYEPTLAQVVDVKENRHTDSGTLTMLFYEKLGLHVNFRSSNEWAFAPAKPGSALVNVADSLQRLSSGTFHSPTHRVTQPCDGFSKRYYLSYFLRPEEELKDSWARSS